MKKHNASKVVLVTMLLFLLLTWILPAAYYSSEYVDQGRTQMGLFDLFNYPLTSLAYFGYIGLYLVLVGGFYGVLYKIPAYRTLLDKIVNGVKGKEKLVLAVMVVLIAALVSICGVQVGIALFIPFFVSLILLMGYDKIVAALVVAGSISAGLIGTTYAKTNTDILTKYLDLDSNYQIYVRLALLLVGIILVIFNVLMYIRKHFDSVKVEKKVAHKIEEDLVVEEVKPVVKKTTTKTTTKTTKKTTKKSSSKSRRSDNKAALKEEDVIVVKEAVMKEDSLVPAVVAERHSIWPMVAIISLLFILFVLAFIPWDSIGVTKFSEITSAMKDYTLFKFPIFSKILGTVNPFGSWTITDLFFPMAFAITLLVLIYNVSFDDMWDGFISGAKKAFAPAVIVLFLYTILVMVTYHSFQLPIYKAIIGLSKKFNIVTTLGVGLLCGFFNSDISYSFQSVVPYYASVIETTKQSLVAIIFQSMYGFAMLFVPTSLTLMATLSYLNVSYKDWLKNSWKLILELFVVLLIAFIALAYLVK